MDRVALVSAALLTEGALRPALHSYRDLAGLPSAAAALFADPADDLYASRAWYATLIAHALPQGAEPIFAVCEEAGAPFGLVPLVRSATPPRLASLTGLYTCGFRPLIASPDRAFEVGRLLGRTCRGVPVVRFDAIDAAAPWLSGFVAGLRRAGFNVRPFDCFGNWYEPVEGVSFTQYLARRPGALRTTIRRKIRHANADFQIVTGGEALSGAIADYQAVYAKSWKDPEPFPDFNPALMRQTAALGLLRLGILRLSGEVAAAQLWVVSGGRASVLKLAHDEAFARASPGTVLTALMIEQLLAREQIRELDFGRGDDPYKRLWTSERRQRIGLILADPRKPLGLLEIARSTAGAARRRLRRRLTAHPASREA